MRAWWLLPLSACGFSADSGPPGDATPADARRVDAATDAAIDAMIDAPLPVCPADYAARDGSHYRFVSNTATWPVAEADCEDDSIGLTHLVVLGSNELATVDAVSSASRTWVGLSDRVTDGLWLWVTSGTGPALGSGQSSCAQLDEGNRFGGAQLQADDCTTGRSYVCECDLTPANPATY